MPLPREGVIENHQGFSHRFGKIVTRLGKPTPLNVVPWELHRRDRFVYGDHTFVNGVEYYYYQSFLTQDAAVEAGQEHIGMAPYRVEEIEKGSGRFREIVKMFPNIDGSPPSVIVTFKNGEYHLLTDDTTGNYQRQQELLKAWRETLASDDPEPFEKAYWGIGRKFLESENGVDTSQVPSDVMDIMTRIGFTAKTSEESRAEAISSIFSKINVLRKEAGVEPLEPPIRPLVELKRRPVYVRQYRRRR